MTPMKNRAINYGKSDLRTMIENNYRYIDKTESIYNLISSSIDCVFLSRPRRFGKSLLIDTLSEIFSGNKELFKDLAIYKKDYDWESYPVIKLDMTEVTKKDPKEFKRVLTDKIRTIGLKLDVDLSTITDIKDPSSYMNNLLDTINKTKGKVIVLIDEYDYPLISNVDTSLDNMKEILDILKEFYLSFKSNGSCIKFLLLTGVTRIAKSSIFSGLNNLKDISFNPKFSDLLGYTQDELESYFSNEIETGAKNSNLNKDSFILKIKEWYDGYHFSDSNTSVYNPSDINLFFQDECKFSSYWVQTGTPAFLVNLLSQVSKIDLENELQYPRGDNFFLSTLNLNSLKEKDNLILLLYQTGYLTVISANRVASEYYLGFPNKEVELAFNSYIIENVWNKNYDFFESRKKIGEYLVNNDKDKFFLEISNLFKEFSSLPQKYHENAVTMPIVLVLKLAGLKVYEQVHTGLGIADIVVESKDTIYIIEIKMDEKASIAIKQIEDKKYMDKYLLDPNYSNFKIIEIGLSFNSSKCLLIDSEWKEFNR